MVKLTFEFYKAGLAKAGLTENDLLTEVRKYAKENKIAETFMAFLKKTEKMRFAY